MIIDDSTGSFSFDPNDVINGINILSDEINGDDFFARDQLSVFLDSPAGGGLVVSTPETFATQFSNADVAAVPEPSGLAVLTGMVGLAATTRRRLLGHC